MLPSIHTYGQLSAGLKPRPPDSTRRKKRQRVIGKAPVESAGPSDVGTYEVLNDLVKGKMPERMQVQLWLDSFHQERDQYKSVTAYAELFYARVLGATEDLPEPNLLRTATCMMLLEQVTSLFGRYRPLLKSLCEQVESAIFIPTPAQTRLDDPAINELLCSKYIRTTYFDAYAELAAQHDSLQQKSTAMEDAMIRQMKVLEHAIQTWQRVFLEKVFLGWRGYVMRQKMLRDKYKSMFANNIAKVRMQTAWRNWCLSLDMQKWKSAEDGVSAVGTAIERLTRERDALKEELQRKDELLEQREQRIASLIQENASLKTDKRAAYEKYTIAQSVSRKLSHILHERLTVFKHPKNDWQAKKRVESIAQQQGDGLELLLTWANTLIQSQCGDEYLITDFSEQIKSGMPHLYLLRGMAPAVCSEGWLIRCVGEVDVLKRCDQIMTTCRAINVRTDIKVEDIIKGVFEINYMFFVQCFRRFVDPCGSRVVLCDTSGPDKDTANWEKVAPDEWEEQWRVALTTQKRWADKLSSVSFKLDNELCDSMRKGMSKAVTSKKQAEQQASYCDLPLDSFADLLTSSAGTPKEVHQRITKELRSHYPVLRRVFKYYSVADALKTAPKSETAFESMSFAEFNRMLTDCKLADKKLRPNLNLVIARLRQEITIVSNAAHPQDRISPKEFSLAVLHIAVKKYNGELADRLRRLVVDSIEPHAKASAAEQFKAEVGSPAVQFVVSQYSDDLTKLYQQYSRQDQHQKTKDANSTIDVNEWLSFVKSYNLADATLTISAVKHIFHGIQDDASDDSALTMNFTEFTEAVAALSFYKYPSPFEPFSQRLHKFLKSFLFDK